MLLRKLLCFISIFVSYITAQCPDVVPPCICATTSLEPVHILCDQALSLQNVLASIITANNSVKIDVLTINNTRIDILPSNAFAGFIVSKLQLRKSKIAAIADDAFSGTLTESLRDLDLADNEFVAIPLAVAELKQLTRLSLARNKIEILSSKFMKTWKSRMSVVSLDLSGNHLEEMDAIAALPNLQDLNIAGNRLNIVPTEMLASYAKTMKNLNLASNRIVEVKSSAFNMELLQSLSLEFNNITKVAADAFHGLSNMMYLYLTGNQLQQWTSETFRSLNNLRNLGLGSSRIKEIPSDAFKYLPKLLRLEMSNGGVETIGNDAFKGAPRLHAILLNNNRITKIKRGTFTGLTDLYTLDLSNNRIVEVEDYSFSKLPALKHVDLSNNELTTLQPHTFNETFLQGQDAKNLYICKNPWTCDASLNWFRRWMRENLEIIVDKPGCAAVCTAPEWLSKWPIRFPNPPPPDSNFTRPTVNSIRRQLPDVPIPERQSVFSGISEFLFGQLPSKLRHLLRIDNRKDGT